MNTLRDLLVHEIKDLYHAEKQLTKALPKMANAASHDELKSAFNEHLEETKHQIERLEQILRDLDLSPRGTKCVAMEGLIAEGEKILKEDSDPAVRDAAIITVAQRIEHYEIAGYGCARALAAQLDEKEIVKLLEETLEEESAADEILTNIAESTVNVDAMSATA